MDYHLLAAYMLMICKDLKSYKILFFSPAASSSEIALEEIWNIFNNFTIWPFLLKFKSILLNNEWEILKIQRDYAFSRDVSFKKLR